MELLPDLWHSKRWCCSDPSHLDEQDGTLTVIGQLQNSKTPSAQQGRFFFGNHVVSMKDGFVAVFNGRTCLHGAWASQDSTDFLGFAFVTRRLKLQDRF